MILLPAIAFSLLIGSSCGAKSSDSVAASESPANEYSSTFDADSAYSYVARQVSFGPRVAGSEAHDLCAAWIASEIERHGGKATVGDASRILADGSRRRVMNVSGTFRPEAPRRVLLLAHYDTRSTADQDPDPTKRNSPFDGANDGASGVGVVLEIARHWQELPEQLGLDVLLTDAEDDGNYSDDASWCIGSQLWAEELGESAPRPEYAILLDMVGGHGAIFTQEYFSMIHAREVVDRVWAAARRAGHADRFPNTLGGAINDDHVPLIGAGIAAIDIVEMSNPQTGSFNPTWHTTADNLGAISKATLKAVGETVMETLNADSK